MARVGLFGIARFLKLRTDRLGDFRFQVLQVGTAKALAAGDRNALGTDDHIGPTIGRMAGHEADTLRDERALGDVAGAVEFCCADWIELHRTGRRIGVNEDRCREPGFNELGIGCSSDPMRGRKIENERQEHAADHYWLSADAVAQPAKIDVERRTDDGHHNE